MNYSTVRAPYNHSLQVRYHAVVVLPMGKHSLTHSLTRPQNNNANGCRLFQDYQEEEEEEEEIG